MIAESAVGKKPTTRAIMASQLSNLIAEFEFGHHQERRSDMSRASDGSFFRRLRTSISAAAVPLCSPHSGSTGDPRPLVICSSSWRRVVNSWWSSPRSSALHGRRAW